MSTLHTLDAAETINRIIDFFQPHEHQHVRAMLAGTLKGIVSQRLAPTADGEGRVAVCEILTMTGRVHDAILDADSDMNLADIMAEGEHYGMQTFDQALYLALSENKIDLDTAMRVSSHPHDLKLLVQAGGRVSTTMDDLEDRIRILEAKNPAQPSEPAPPGEHTSYPEPTEEERAGDPPPTEDSQAPAPARVVNSVPPPGL
jgi:Tfp pilus assembly ATPase PilU